MSTYKRLFDLTWCMFSESWNTAFCNNVLYRIQLILKAFKKPFYIKKKNKKTYLDSYLEPQFWYIDLVLMHMKERLARLFLFIQTKRPPLWYEKLKRQNEVNSIMRKSNSQISDSSKLLVEAKMYVKSADVYLLKVNNKDTRTTRFIINFEHIQYLVLLFLLLTLNL